MANFLHHLVMYSSASTFFGLIHPCHRLLHSHSSYYECMADVATITVNRVFIVRPRYLFYFVHNILSAMQQIEYDLQTWFD